jgi:hypothetical protein
MAAAQYFRFLFALGIILIADGIRLSIENLAGGAGGCPITRILAFDRNLKASRVDKPIGLGKTRVTFRELAASKDRTPSYSAPGGRRWLLLFLGCP